MGRGRPRKTIDELKKAGTYRPSRHGEHAGKPSKKPAAKASASKPPVISHTTPTCEIPAPVLPTPVDLIGTPAGGLFAKYSQSLGGKLEPSDAPALAAACRNSAEAKRCKDAAAALEPESTAHGRCTRSGLAYEVAANQLLAKFNVTPVDRARIEAEKMASEPWKPQVMTRPPFALERVSAAWVQRFPSEEFPPADESDAGRLFGALVDAEDRIENDEHERLKAVDPDWFCSFTQWCHERSAGYQLPDDVE